MDATTGADRRRPETGRPRLGADRQPPTALWWVAATMFAAGGVASWIALALPPTTSIDLRAASATLGTLLIAAAGIVGSYQITYSQTVSSTELYYRDILLSIGRSTARAWATLHKSTEQRRQGSYSHEETYQAMIISTAESLLEQYEAIIRLSGSDSNAFKAGKEDLDAITERLYSDRQNVADANIAVGTRGDKEPVPVTVRCPYCGSRTPSKIALEAGRSASARCPSCRNSFNIHRLQDLSVYPSPHPETAARLSGRANHKNTTSEVIGNPGPQVPTSQVACTGCGHEFSFSRSSLVIAESDGLGVLPCSNCMAWVRVDPVALTVSTLTPFSIESTPVVGRDSARPSVNCLVDQAALHASIRLEGRWIAPCRHHLRAYEVGIASFREWLRDNDPSYLEFRTNAENSGEASRILTAE